MTLVLIEVANEAAVERLRSQAGIQVVGIITPPASEPKHSIASLAGTLSNESAARMRAETAKLRSEWEREF